MRKIFVCALTSVLLVLSAGLTVFAEEAPKELVEFANSTLAKLGTDPVIVKAVMEQNAKGMSLDDIRAMDDKWKAAVGLADYMKAIIESECGQKLLEIKASQPYYAELFVMDNQGANVCMSDKTSDYWQGDEAKFEKSYAGGKGAVFVDDVEFDESTQAYLSQVSVPVKDGAEVIGAITIGVDIDRLEASK